VWHSGGFAPSCCLNPVTSEPSHAVWVTSCQAICQWSPSTGYFIVGAVVRGGVFASLGSRLPGHADQTCLLYLNITLAICHHQKHLPSSLVYLSDTEDFEDCKVSWLYPNVDHVSRIGARTRWHANSIWKSYACFRSTRELYSNTGQCA
jgi:hypothetical protein